MTKSMLWRVLPAWLVGNVAAYFLTSLFINFYTSAFALILLSLLFQVLCACSAVSLLLQLKQTLYTDRGYEWFALIPLLIAFLLNVAAVTISWQFPGLFDRHILFMETTKLPVFLGASIFPLFTLIWFERKNFTERWQQTKFFQGTQPQAPGILLALFFLFAYFVFAQSINFPHFRTLDQYFDTDVSEWLQRFTVTSPADVDRVRAVHPAILIFLRPLISAVSILFNGDRLQAIFLLIALAGAACVFLTWLIIKRASSHTGYTLLIALWLGISTSHLLFGAMLETYIFSAMTLLIFVALVQNEKNSLKYTIPAGIFVFGITITNLAQTCILYFFNHPRIKVIIQYIVAVVLATVALNLLQVWFYPNARLLSQPSNLLSEQRYTDSPFQSRWRTAGRISLTARAILLYGIAAPTPFILTRELGVDVPNFRTFQILPEEFRVASYHGFANITVKFWIGILLLAGLLFTLGFLKSPKQTAFPFSLLVCIGFSFGLHLLYGDDPLLYSPDWVYALVLFVGLQLQRWADRKVLQVVMIMFLLLLMVNNLGLIHQILQVSAPFYGTR